MPRPDAGDEQPVADPPADVAVVGLDRVLGRLKAQQRQRRISSTTAAVLAVDDPDQPERDPGEEQPVGAGQVLQVGRASRCAPGPSGQGQLGRLDRADRAVAGRPRSSCAARRSPRRAG